MIKRFVLLELNWKIKLICKGDRLMSVGVCVINRNGIALSTDSAGTFGLNKMFYNSVNKLFKVSNKYSCGAIIYNDLSINSVSVEQVIKEFSIYLDSVDSFNDLYDIVSLFEKFIGEKYTYYGFDKDEVDCTHTLIKALVDEWGVKINDVLCESDGCNKAEIIIEELRGKIKKSLKTTSVSMRAYLSDKYRSFYDGLITNNLQNLSIDEGLKQELWDSICDYFALALDREKNKTGIFFAGYGTDDAYAKFIGIEVRAVLGGTIKFIETERFEAANGFGKILPLAQEDVVYTFCKGISQKYIDVFPQYVSESIEDKISTLPDTFTTEQIEEIKQIFSTCGNEITKRIIKKMHQENIEPLMKSVPLISLPEMAFLAESLVNITSLKRTYSLDGYQQTVGGPTDVAVLSKAEGFSWIKTK